jgi:hypothetical protein
MSEAKGLTDKQNCIVLESQREVLKIFLNDWIAFGALDDDRLQIWKAFNNCPIEKEACQKYVAELPYYSSVISYIDAEKQKKLFDLFTSVKKKILEKGK